MMTNNENSNEDAIENAVEDTFEDAINRVPTTTLRRFILEDAVGQLRRREGLIAKLGSENGEMKLDWVEGIARLLEDPAKLEQVEHEARDIWERGIRHIIWAGMGGSVIAVHVLTELGFCGETPQPGTEYITIYPLDSTDPAALNAIVRKIASAKQLNLPATNVGTRLIASTNKELPDFASTNKEFPDTVPIDSELPDIASTNSELPDPAFLRTLLADVLMIGVSMGMTSEEPITHLTWFSALLEQAQLSMAEHLLVMTLPGSYLDQFAREHGAPSRSLQLDRGTGTGGRMSAPTTRVFLLPAALALANLSHPSQERGRLSTVLSQAWELYNLELATVRPAEHPFVRLAAAMSEASRDGVCFVLLRMPKGWQALLPWIEQLMEESLGKGGKGVVVFDDQMLKREAPNEQGEGTLRVEVAMEGAREDAVSEDAINRVPTEDTDGDGEIASAQMGERVFVLEQPYLSGEEPVGRLTALASCFLGWQLSMALYGYAQGIMFAGQPAVENYKARARALRMQDDPLRVVEQWGSVSKDGILSLCMPEGIEGAIMKFHDQDRERFVILSAAKNLRRAYERFLAALRMTVPTLIGNLHNRAPTSIFAGVLREARVRRRLGYLDVTVNGEAAPALVAMLEQKVRRIGNELLGVPVKVRRAPAAYHSTEQSEMDGPPSLVSLRLLGREHERCLIGEYNDRFLCAQAVSTWQAMLEQGRTCLLLVVDGYLHDAVEPLAEFFTGVEQQV